MELVEPSERTAAASVTSLARSAGSASSPVLSGLLLQRTVLTLGLPFLAAGGLKAAYDVALWLTFRRVPLEEGRDRGPEPARQEERPSLTGDS